MKYINKSILKTAISETVLNDKIINDDILTVYNIINDIINNYNIFKGNYDFTPYLVDNGQYYIYIIGRRKSDNLEFIIDEDFFVSEPLITEKLILDNFIQLDSILFNKINEYKL